MSGDLAGAARCFARRGLRVHPCRPGRKEPILDAWQKVATLDQGQIAKWWRQRPDANVGIACGGPANLLVVDIDPDSGGEASMQALEAEHGTLPETVEVITPRGGRHIYLFVRSGEKMPGNSAGKLGKGIDTRGRGGYVVAPPSTVNGRAYTWSVDSAAQIAYAPSWLLAALAKVGGDGKATDPEEWLKLITQGVDQGERNQSIAKIAGLLFRRLPEPAMAAELIVCWHQIKCHPPLAADELKRTLDSIAEREMQRRGLGQQT